MPTAPISIADLNHRLPTAGRIRIGEKVKVRNPKPGKSDTVMASIDVFRFTSPDRALIDQIAQMYGGDVAPWQDPKANPPNQWQVKTTTNRIPVVLLPDAISQWWELWSGGGIARRCTGITCEVPGPDGFEQVPCLCTARGRLECATQTRISCLLPDLPLRGLWMLATKSKNARHEIPGMFDVIRALATSNYVRAELGVERRNQMIQGEKHNFVVPTLTLPVSPTAAVAGASSLGALTAAPPAVLMALPPGSAAPSNPPLEDVAAGPGSDDIVDAEIVTARELDLHARVDYCANHYIVDPTRLWYGMMASVDDNLDRVETGVQMMEAGQLQPGGFADNGLPVWIKVPPPHHRIVPD